MKPTPKEPHPASYLSTAEKADPKILSLFPTLNIRDVRPSQKRRAAALKHLACIYAVGKNGPASARRVSEAVGISYSSSAACLKKLSALSLLKAELDGRRLTYSLTPKGIVLLMSFEEFRSFASVKPLLSDFRNRDDRLAYALLLIGYSANRSDIVYSTLAEYAGQGHNLELLDYDASAESILKFYSDRCKSEGKSTPQYLDMFREFTTAGFQDILRMLLTAIKPRPEDYNLLVQFFYELVEFYYNPVRMAYRYALSENPNLRSRLEQFKKEQESRIRTEGSKMELTFKVPGGSELYRFMSMPPHLKAMGLKLVLEPLQFMTQELKELFWPAKEDVPQSITKTLSGELGS